MTHELKKIIKAYTIAKKEQKKTVLATVVALEGSSYRRPGVRMLITEDHKITGAVSGGCVEKEIIRQAQSVLRDHIPKIMSYDGRFRLGCEGVLYILIEPFDPKEGFLRAFEKAVSNRDPIDITSYYQKKDSVDTAFGSIFQLGDATFKVNHKLCINDLLDVFEQTMEPTLKLILIGAEHDAVQLCSYAAMTGWEVTVIAPMTEEKDISDFPGISEFKAIEPTSLDVSDIDSSTAIILMTHSYVKDLKYLLALNQAKPGYLGLLGPADRREKLLNDLLERHPLVPDFFLDSIHGPAGLNIGAETPQEIAIAILAEILTVFRDKKPMRLKYKPGRIHS